MAAGSSAPFDPQVFASSPAIPMLWVRWYFFIDRLPNGQPQLAAYCTLLIKPLSNPVGVKVATQTQQDLWPLSRTGRKNCKLKKLRTEDLMQEGRFSLGKLATEIQSSKLDLKKTATCSECKLSFPLRSL
jgi:hypothetical protein